MPYWILQETMNDNGQAEQEPVRWIEELPPSDVTKSRLVTHYLNGSVDFSITLLAGPFHTAAAAVAWLVENAERWA